MASIFFVVMAVLLLTAAGCGDSDTDGDDGGDAPVVPPAYTFVPNFGELGNTESATSADEMLADPMIKRQPVTDTAVSIQAGDDNEGGFIEYGVIDDDTYDAFYDIYNAGQENQVEIDASTTSNEGRVTNPDHFGDEDWHYWDGNHCDSVAPAS